MSSYRISYTTERQAIEAEKRYLHAAEGGATVGRAGTVLIVTPPPLVAPLLRAANALLGWFRLRRTCQPAAVSTGCPRSEPAD